MGPGMGQSLRYGQQDSRCVTGCEALGATRAVDMQCDHKHQHPCEDTCYRLLSSLGENWRSGQQENFPVNQPNC